MTREEAIFCEKSYIGETNCVDCKYYGTDTCQSRVSHRMAVKALELEPRWISVSERLPEDSGEYLVSIIDEYNENQSYYKAVGIAWFAHKKDYDIKESEWRELGIDETVIAWMPLPKPYKAESEG